MSTVILRTIAPLLVLTMLVFSVFVLLRGHNEPGGGFSGGLVAAAAFALLTIATDVPTTRRTLRMSPRIFIGAGLLVAIASGAIGLIGGGAFLTGVWAELSLPGGAKLAVGTPLLFDVGVYLVVIGVVLTIVLSLMEA